MKKNIFLAALMSLTLVLTGCSATNTLVKKRDLDVQTKMSDTVFLDPVAPSKRTVFLQIRNTSDKPNLDIKSDIKTKIESRGYKVLEDPSKAHYMIQANILQVGKADLRESENFLSQGFGSAVGGALAGAQFGGGSGRGAASLAGAAIGLVADAMVEDVYYSMITDLQISERASDGVVVTEALDSQLAQGSSSKKVVKSTEKTQWKRYQTRVLSTANKVNLEFAEAEPELKKGLTQSISGLL
jgi:Enterobacterial TraT complement resistance protein.